MNYFEPGSFKQDVMDDLTGWKIAQFKLTKREAVVELLGVVSALAEMILSDEEKDVERKKREQEAEDRAYARLMSKVNSLK